MVRNSINPWQPAGQAGFQNLSRLISLRLGIAGAIGLQMVQGLSGHHPLIPFLQPGEGVLGQQQVFPSERSPHRSWGTGRPPGPTLALAKA